MILFCPRKKKINSKSITSRAAAYLKETEEPNKYKKVSECLEGLQDAYVREQACHQVKRPPGEGERRTSFIKLEIVAGDEAEGGHPGSLSLQNSHTS